jgi:hypothetical protein
VNRQNDITDTTIQLVYDIGAGMTVELDVVDVYAISANTFSDNFLTPIYIIFENSMYKIGRGWTSARTSDFLEMVNHCEIDISIVNHTGVSLTLEDRSVTSELMPRPFVRSSSRTTRTSL